MVGNGGWEYGMNQVINSQGLGGVGGSDYRYSPLYPVRSGPNDRMEGPGVRGGEGGGGGTGGSESYEIQTALNGTHRGNKD
jgi:hypothetical protein